MDCNHCSSSWAVGIINPKIFSVFWCLVWCFQGWGSSNNFSPFGLSLSKALETSGKPMLRQAQHERQKNRFFALLGVLVPCVANIGLPFVGH